MLQEHLEGLQKNTASQNLGGASSQKKLNRDSPFVQTSCMLNHGVSQNQYHQDERDDGAKQQEEDHEDLKKLDTNDEELLENDKDLEDDGSGMLPLKDKDKLQFEMTYDIGIT